MNSCCSLTCVRVEDWEVSAMCGTGCTEPIGRSITINEGIGTQ